MQISRTSLDEAIAGGVLSREQGEALWAWLAERERDRPSFRAAHILYYLGGMIAIGAMTLFMTLGWERFGGTGLFVIAVAYGIVALGLTEWCSVGGRYPIPAGIMAVLAVVMVPLAVYGLQHAMGLWPASNAGGSYREYHTRIDWRWLMMEFATLAAGAIALWRYRFPFLVMPVAVTLWYMSMDLLPFLAGGESQVFWSEDAKRLSVVFGILMTLVAFWIDVRTSGKRDFAFWLYLFGVLTFWGGLSSMDSDSELGKFAYCCINLAMIAVGAALSRRVFAVFGGLGVALYLGHLSHSLFEDSMLFPVALTAIGLLVVAAGAVWQRHEDAIGAALRARLPAALGDLVTRRGQ